MSWVWWVGVVAVVGVVLPPPASPCSCFSRHPQQHVCEADFVVMARVRRVTETLDGLTAYKVRVKRLLKATEKVELSLQKGLIYTIPGTCESKLQSRTTYVITGNVEASKPWTNLCHFVKPWKKLSPKMKKGFRLLYQSGCDCPIMSCHYWQSCPKASFFCPWETSTDTEDCQARHAVCLRGPDGTCGWLGGRFYRGCMKSRRFGGQPNTTNNTTTTIVTLDHHHNAHSNRINHHDNRINHSSKQIEPQDNEIDPQDNRITENDSLPSPPLGRRGRLSRLGYKRVRGPGELQKPQGQGKRPLRRRPIYRRPHPGRSIGYVPKEG